MPAKAVTALVFALLAAAPLRAQSPVPTTDPQAFDIPFEGKMSGDAGEGIFDMGGGRYGSWKAKRLKS